MSIPTISGRRPDSASIPREIQAADLNLDDPAAITAAVIAARQLPEAERLQVLQDLYSQVLRNTDPAEFLRLYHPTEEVEP